MSDASFKSILDLTVKSVKKKWKSRGFAAGVDRHPVLKGSVMIGMKLGALMQVTIDGMQKGAEAIGLRGNL